MSFMTSPPWTLPYGFASDGSIVRVMTVFDRATVFASGTGADASLARCPSSRAKSSARPSPARLGSAANVREPAAREDMPADKDGWWDLHRGAYVITYREKVNLPADLMGLLRPRSTLLRSGVSIHGAVWDAGYSGRGEGLMAVLNSRGYRLQRGARVAQLVFFRLSAATAEGYKGKYHGENV